MNNPLGVSTSKRKQGTTRGKEKSFDLGGNPTHDLRNRSTVTLPTSCKSASRFCINQKFEPPTAERRMLQANLDEQAISDIHSIPFKVTKDIRLAIFQFRVVHHILPTNANVCRDKIVEHDKCHLYHQKQTMNHLLVSCPDVQIFWQSFSRWWNVKNDDYIVLNDETITYGVTNDCLANNSV